MRISDWSSDVCSSDLSRLGRSRPARKTARSLRSSDSTATGHARECPAFHDRLIIGVDLSDFPAGSGRAGCRAELTVSLEGRSEEHTSELQSLMRISYAVFCLKKKKHNIMKTSNTHNVS